MRELEKNIQERAEKIIKETIERAERIREKEFIFAKKKEQGIIVKERAKVDKAINAERNSLKAQIVLEFRLREENFKDKLCQDLLFEAKQEMDSLDKGTRLTSLKNLIREALLNLDLKKAHILVNKRDEAVLKEHYEEVLEFIREKIDDFEDISIEGSLNYSGGAIVKTEPSGEFFDNTFERKFERFDEEFKEKILERLD